MIELIASYFESDRHTLSLFKFIEVYSSLSKYQISRHFTIA